MIRAFKTKKRWLGRRLNPDFIPQYGDTVFYDWDGDGKADHVGIVINVESGVTPHMQVVEGNYSDMVKIRNVAWNDSRIIG